MLDLIGYSVLEMVRAFENACGTPVPFKVGPRRSDDIAACYADPALALTLLGWRAPPACVLALGRSH